MTLFNPLLIGLVASATLALSESSGESGIEQQRFVARDENGQIIATVTMEQPLPAHDTSLTFEGPSGSEQADSLVLVEPMVFEVAGAFQCHWSRLIDICGTVEPGAIEARTADGGYVFRLDAETFVVSDMPRGVAGDFATFREGRLVAFGVLDQSGATPWRYDAL